MAQDITGFGAIVQIVASNTYPVGVTIEQFADDADPLDFAAIQIADTAMGLNGDLISWSKAVPIPMVLNVIPGSEADLALTILADNNRVGQGKASAYDRITATVIYPDGSRITLPNGVITNYNPGKGIASAGRLKTRSYAFSFEGKV